MWESAVTWAGLVLVVVGLALLARPAARLGVPTRGRALALAGLVLPSADSRITTVVRQNLDL